VGESGKEYCRRVPRMGSIVVALFLKIWFTIAPDWKKTVYWIIKDTFIHYLFCVEFSSVQFSHSVMFDSFRPHALQHARPPCPSPTPGAYPNSCPLSQWCHPTISSSVIPFSSRLQFFATSGSFPSVSSSHQVANVLELQLQYQSIQWIFTFDFFRIDWFDLLTVQGTLRTLLQYHSLKASILQFSAFSMIQLSHTYMTTGKTRALTTQTFAGKVISLLFNTLSRFVIAILPRSKHLFILWLQSLSTLI